MSSIDKHNPARHTPGPWRIGPTQDEGNGIQSVAILAGEGPTLWGVAKLGIVDTLRDAATQTANAHLIVAAPNMLEGHRYIKAMAQAMTWNKETRNLANEILSLVDPIIAKAEGRT